MTVQVPQPSTCIFYNSAQVYTAKTLRISAVIGVVTFLLWGMFSFPALSATSIPFTVAMSEAVNVTGCPTNCPRIAVTVDGQTRYAQYSAGTGSSSLTFTYAPTIGDLDLDGVTLTSPIDLNGGTITDLNGNSITPLTFTVPDTSGIKIDYPSLSMDFVYDADGRYTLNGTAYNDLSSFIGAAGGTYTRESTATYFDSTGTLQTAASGVPRFDHDPVSHAARGILIEEQRTNYRTYSSEMDNAIWTRSGVNMLANDFTAPDGTLTAEKMTPTAGTSSHRIYEAAKHTVTSGNPYTASVFVKSEGQQYIDLYLGYTNFPSGNGATFDLNNGTITRTFVSTTPKIESIGGGWYRCSITVSAISNGSSNSAFFIVHSTNSGVANTNTTADGTSGYYLWGAQYELGHFPTSYIPTTTAAVTRAKDLVNIPTTSWYNQSTGTFFNDVSWQTVTGSSYPMFFRVDDTTNDNRWNNFFKQSTSQVGVDAYNGAAGQGSWLVNSSLSGSMKIASSQKLNSSNSAFGGVLQIAKSSWDPPPVTRLFFEGGSAQKWFKALRYYPSYASDTQLQLLTQ
ncbi:MAG: hypothetical protein PHX61_05635 [Alphaproteobacteria bacterium]|nr:hypothetical protein [Alphaproteobacteria bacterium]